MSGVSFTLINGLGRSDARSRILVPLPAARTMAVSDRVEPEVVTKMPRVR